MVNREATGNESADCAEQNQNLIVLLHKFFPSVKQYSYLSRLREFSTKHKPTHILAGGSFEEIQAHAKALTPLLAQAEPQVPKTVIRSEGTGDLPLNGDAIENSLKAALDAAGSESPCPV